MPITTSASNENLIISIKGRMDARFITEKRQELELLPQEIVSDVLFDLSCTDFIDSSGIGFLVYIYKRLKPQNRKMGIVGLNGQPKEVIKMLRIDKMINCVDTVEEFEKINQGHVPGTRRAALKKLVSRKRFFRNTTSQAVTRP